MDQSVLRFGTVLHMLSLGTVLHMLSLGTVLHYVLFKWILVYLCITGGVNAKEKMLLNIEENETLSHSPLDFKT